MEYEELIRIAKSRIAGYENDIIIYEQELGGKGESGITRYY